MDELKAAEHELRRELSHRKHEMRTLQDDVNKTSRRSQLVSRELNTVNEQLDTLQVSLSLSHVGYTASCGRLSLNSTGPTRTSSPTFARGSGERGGLMGWQVLSDFGELWPTFSGSTNF